MSYTVLARKYRPQTFKELVGQDHIAKSLKNAIESERVAHAFLFTGVRGVGKTTSARLLAKALNCEKGPTHSPCNQCDSCMHITTGTDLDVLEIDGASNNSVEDVRKLQESLPYRPSKARYKIVIVDEVHMLSQGAFNAFLKTLEEPPAHVKFIFATTEAHKVPTTIRSRCQRYDFRLISEKTIANQLRTILEKENIQSDEDSIILIAREAQGSMRDALTIVDQLIALGQGNLSSAEVSSNLGLANRKTLVALIEAMLLKQPQKTIEAFDQAQKQGVDPLYLSKQLARLVRDLVLIKTLGTDTTQIEMVEEEREALVSLVEKMPSLELQRTFDNLSHLVDNISKSTISTIALEMGLLSIASRPAIEDIDNLIQKLEQLTHQNPHSRDAKLKKKIVSAKLETSRTNTPNPPSSNSISPPAEPSSNTKANSSSDSTVSSVNQKTEPSQKASTVATSITSDEQLFNLQKWEPIVSEIITQKPALGVILKHAFVKEINSKLLHIQFQNDFYIRQVDQPETRKAIAISANTILGNEPELKIEKVPPEQHQTLSIATQEREIQQKRLATSKEEALSHPTVLKVKDFFPEASEIEVVVEQTNE